MDKNKVIIQENNILKKKNFPSNYSLLSIDVDNFKTFLKSKSKSKEDQSIIKLPNAVGGFSNFIIKETSNFEAKLAEKYSMIKSYSAQGIDDPTAVAKISMGTDGFHAIVFSGVEKTLYVDPYSKDGKTLMVYKRTDLAPDKDGFTCHVEETVTSVAKTNSIKNANDGKLRTFRLALACSGEYAEFHLTNQNISTAATDEVKKAAVLSAMNTTMTRVNGVYERDLAVRMVIVADNDKIIFLDAGTDNITDGDPDAMLNEVQTICDSKIGNANYDIGHVFSIAGDGLAGGGVVCVTGLKAEGVTGRSQPIGDAYDIDYVAHEMGHQFGANHTQNNNDCNRNNSTAVEPGSASTIMGYAGICSPNVQGQSDDYFHAISIAEMWGIIQTSASCAVVSDTNNTAPVADAGADFSIPKSTPFVLKGVGTDADGTASLTYNWEQIDNQIAVMPPASTSTKGPVFRSLQSSSTPNRYMPALATIVSGSTSSTWEVLPSVARDLNFSFLVRDNHAGGGSSARDDMNVSVEDAEAFTVSAPNSDVAWDVGSTQTVSWVKGTTDLMPINCLHVNIKLSVDGGLTFPIMIKENTPNDGVENIVIPNNPSTTSRIMVEAADNIFYNVNSTNFTINSVIPSFVMSNTSGMQLGCNSGNDSVNYTFNFDFVNGFSDPVTLSAEGFPVGANVVFSPSVINSDGNVTMTISNLEGKAAQNYEINVKGVSTSLDKNVAVVLDLKTADFNELTLISPQDEADNIDLFEELKWALDTNAVSYQIEIAKDPNFSEIVSSENVTNNSYIPVNLSQETLYFWKVKSVNDCGEGSYSKTNSFTTEDCEVCESRGDADFLTGTTLVEFNTINNASEKEEGGLGYSDYTEIETEIFINSTYELVVNTNTDGEYRVLTQAWIDWNQNCVFDIEEAYDLGSTEDGEDIATSASPFKITVPENARLGKTILRISTKYVDSDDPSAPGSCDLGFDGEVEDYTVFVKSVSIYDAVFEDFNLYPNPTKGEFTLNLKLINTDNVSVQLFDIRGRLVAQKVFLNTNKDTSFSKKISFNNLSGGLYLLKVTNGNKQTTRKLIIE
ncbi:reprolysin-like metallopeptidase [Polaribacter staleyi]|uniref:zinc-dependent metalloprotease n=1 Tax=Polaribacter staleyi TaxID=2022337 RepID=UPI0031BA335F